MDVTFKYLSSGDATNIDEYVPTITPSIIAKEKPFNIAPPKINIENKANNVAVSYTHLTLPTNREV